MPLNSNATNQILPFGLDGLEANGDLMSLADYQSSPLRLRGHQPGIAQRALENRALRQALYVGAGLGQFVANRYGSGVKDNGDIDALEAGIKAAIEAVIAENTPDLSGVVPVSRKVTATTPARVNDVAEASLSANLVLSILTATASRAGSMSAVDFAKLAGIAEGATRLLLATDGVAAAGTDETVAINPKQLATALVALAAALNKPGEVAYFAMDTSPTGWLKANGAAVSRITYAALFAAIGTTYGAGDGSTTFNLPDLRGEFIRCWDDARGVDAGREVGSWQKGTLIAADGGPLGAVASIRTQAASTTISGQQAGVGSDAFSNADYPTEYVGGIGTSIFVAMPGNVEGYAGVTRPRNVALSACIKY